MEMIDVADYDPWVKRLADYCVAMHLEGNFQRAFELRVEDRKRKGVQSYEYSISKQTNRRNSAHAGVKP